MSDEATFLAAMAADPDNDLPRLVFADWLDEHGRGEQAEYVRLTCGPAAGIPENVRRADELLRAHRLKWFAPLTALGGEVGYHRGFPQHLKAEFPLVVEHQHLIALAPEWHLSPTRREWDYEPQPELCERFAAGPHLDRVRGLNLAWAGWLEDELPVLLCKKLVGSLRELRFGDSEGDAEFAALAPHRRLQLTAFGFGGDSYGIGDDGCRRICEDARFAKLHTLELPDNALTAAAAVALATSPHLKRLRDLDLTGGSNSTNTIGPDGAAAIAGSTNFRHLENLNLVHNNIGDDGFVALVTSPHLKKLKLLNLPGNGVTDVGLVALARSKAVPRLSWLNFCEWPEGRITPAGLRVLVDSPRMPTITGLKFARHPLGDDGAAVLADSPNCRNLTELYLSECGVTFAGYVRLLESPHLAGVKEFALAHSGLSKGKQAELKGRFGERVG